MPYTMVGSELVKGNVIHDIREMEQDLEVGDECKYFYIQGSPIDQ